MEQAERRRAQEETRELQAVTEALAAAATPSDVGLAIVRQGVKALGARAATVYALREDGAGLDLIASEGYPVETMSAWEQILLEVQTPLTDAIRSGEIIVCASPEEIADRYPWFDDSDQSFVAAPLVAAGRVIGGIFIGAGEARQYGGNLSLIISLARQAGQALDRAQLFERERASVGRLRKLQAVTAALSQAVTVEDVSRTCLEHATTGVGALAGVVVLRGHGDEAAIDRVAVISAIGLEGPDGEIPAAAEKPIAASLRGGPPVSFDEGWIAFPLASGALRSAARLDEGDLGRRSRMAAHPRQPGRAGPRPRRTVRDGARDRRDDAAQRPPGTAADGQRGDTGSALSPRHRRGRRRRRLVRHHPARGRLDRARRRRRGRQGRPGRGDDGSAPERPARLCLRVRRSAHGCLTARQARRGDDGVDVRDARLPRHRPQAATGAVRRRGPSAAPDPLTRRHDVLPRTRPLAPDRRRPVARVRGGRSPARTGLDDPALHRRPRRAPWVAARRGTRASSPNRPPRARTIPRSSSRRCWTR